MFKILLKNVKKNFSNLNQNKFDDAKKKAMEMYDKIQNQEKVLKNKKVEEEFLKNRKEDKENIDHLNLDVSDYKKNNVQNKIENFLENYQFVSMRKKASPKEEGINLNYYNKIHDDIVYFKLSQDYKNNIDKEKWVKIYEAKFDPNYEKFLNFLNKFLKIVLMYGTILFVGKIYKMFTKEEKKANSMSGKEILLWCVFYTIVTWIFLINRGFINRTIYKLLAKDDKIRIFLNNSNKKEQNKNFVETDIINLFSITSKSKNLHEIFYYGKNQKVLQMFAYKNAFYDKNLLVNLCHPRVKAVKFTNLDMI